MFIRIVMFCLALAPDIVLAIPPAPKVEKISERVYALLAPVGLPDKNNEGYMSNSVVVIGDQGVILIDTGFSDVIGKQIRATIAKLTPKPVTHIINTHHHGDHVLGNVAFPGAQIVSTRECKELVEKEGYQWISILENVTGKKFPDTKPVAANEVIDDGAKIDKVIQGVKMTWWVPKGSHTPGDLMVFLPDDGVLASGDIVVHTMAPSFRDANVKNWIETLGELVKFNAKTIVPGHGRLMQGNEVKEMQQRMAALYAGVEAGYKKGLTDSEVRKTLDLREWEHLVNFNELMGGNINRTYLEIEHDNF